MFLVESVKDIFEADISVSFERFGSVLDAEWINAASAGIGTASV